MHNAILPASPRATTPRPDTALEAVLSEFAPLRVPVLHMLGNHCLWNHPRGILNARLRIDAFQAAELASRGEDEEAESQQASSASSLPVWRVYDDFEPSLRTPGSPQSPLPSPRSPPPSPLPLRLPTHVLSREPHPLPPARASYYSYSPHPRWRVVVLDGYAISLLGWPRWHPAHEAASRHLADRNPNADWNRPDGLEGPARRHVAFGGACGAEQRAWLAAQLAEASRRGQRALVAGHLAFCPGTCAPACLLWDYAQVLEVLRRPGLRGVAVATLAGHAHLPGHVRDGQGVHHLVAPAVLETRPGRDCHALVEVSEEGMRVRGVGEFPSWELAF